MTRSGQAPCLRSALVVALLLAAGVVAGLAQPPAPPPPKTYQVVIRYRIRAAGPQRVPLFNALVRYLASIGFHKDPGPEDEAEDPEQIRMTGTIASADARKILNNRYVQAILLIPAGYQLPAGQQPVDVQLELARVLVPPRERVLADQVRSFLVNVGYQDAIGYDNRGHTRLVGAVPADNVERLLEDLRWQATGWLVPQVPVPDLPLPIRDLWPVQVVEVLPAPAGLAPARALRLPPPIPRGQEYLAKIAPEVRGLPQQDRPVRLEVVLAATPGPNELGWQRELAGAAPGSLIEGRLGQTVILAARPNQAPALARLGRVLSIRLSRPATLQPVPEGRRRPNRREVLEATGLAQLHANGQRGRGVRVAIVDEDFRGYEAFVGKELPRTTRYVDLTAACTPDVRPMPLPGKQPPVGHGTQCALAAALAAPEAELTLIRIDPLSPYQLLAVARAINGEIPRLECLDRQADQIAADTEALQRRREELLAERRRVLDNFSQAPEAVRQREAYFKSQEEFNRQEQELQGREQRLLRLERDVQDLRGIRVVACALVWDDGYPVDGTSVLTQYLDNQPFAAAVWFQSAGDARRQAWAGLFRDADGNGVMEFAPPGAPLRPQRWTPELNFLGWQRTGGALTADLPRGAYRIAVQWREPHDPTLWRPGEDAYPLPLAAVRLLVLRQRDPEGKRLPADVMEPVAVSLGVPLHLDNQPDAASYEQTVEFVVDQPGRYALRVEGTVPASIRPPIEVSLPALQVRWELRPRLFFSRLDEPWLATGRPVFLDYATDLGDLGTPADAHRVLTVGAGDLDHGREPYSSGGPGFGQSLNPKPDLLAPDRLPLPLPEREAEAGAGIASGFAAGLAAASLSAGRSPEQLVRGLRGQPDRFVRVPAAQPAAPGRAGHVSAPVSPPCR